MTEALVINLDRSPERWAASCAALTMAGFAVERVAAVDARAEPTSPRYDATRNRDHYFAPLKSTEIACFRSHRHAWAQVVRKGCAALVCEDDVEGDDDLLTVTERLSHRLSGPVAVKLYAKRPVAGPCEPLGARSLVRPRDVPLGCVAMWLTPEGAAALLAGSERFHLPVDVYAQQTWEHGVETYVVSPPPVREVSARLGGTTLGGPRSPLSARLVRELRRPLFRARLALRSFKENR